MPPSTSRSRRGAFPRDELRLGLLDDGALRRVGSGGCLEPWPDDGEGERFALRVQGRPAGVIEIRRAGELAERERSVLASLASQLATALENARLYAQLDGLFRSYLSPEVAASLLADPGRAALGGTMQEVTVLMADLEGFTPFSEHSTPAAAARVLAGHSGWPRFRVGLNTGTAIVGNVGSEDLRNFSAIGDTTNVAARLQGAAPAGGILMGARTYELLGPDARVRAVPALELKGKTEPVAAYVLEAVL